MKKLLLPNSAFLGLAVSHRQNLIPDSSLEILQVVHQTQGNYM